MGAEDRRTRTAAHCVADPPRVRLPVHHLLRASPNQATEVITNPLIINRGDRAQRFRRSIRYGSFFAVMVVFAYVQFS